MKLVNLDDLVKVQKAITLGGKEYPIVEQTLGQMIDAMKLEDDENLGHAEQLKLMRDATRSLVPTLSSKQIDGLTMAQLNAIMKLANEEVEVTDDEGKPNA